MNNIISPLAAEAIAVGREHHWTFRVADKIDIPVEPIYESGWWYETLQEAPKQAQKRVATLEAAGIPIKAIIIAHEAPKLLPTGRPDFKIPKIVPKAGKVALGAGKVLVTVAGAAVTAVAVTVAIAGMAVPIMMVATLAIDPKCMCLLQDGTLLEVATWMD